MGIVSLPDDVQLWTDACFVKAACRGQSYRLSRRHSLHPWLILIQLLYQQTIYRMICPF